MVIQALGAGCVRINPYNTEEVARGIHEALSMSAEQRRELHAYAYQYVTKFTAQEDEPSHNATLATHPWRSPPPPATPLPLAPSQPYPCS